MFSLVESLELILGWSIILFIALHLYRKAENLPSIWKVAIAIAVGLFSFSINIPVAGELISLPILPLGVWALNFFLRKRERSWERYRPFAWLGFGANFVFLILALLAIPLQNLIYPEDRLTTYVSDTENASLIVLHPSADDSAALDKKILLEQLEISNQQAVQSEEWYYDTVMDHEMEDRNERFPYQLAEVSAKWGSGFSPLVFIEEDGQGIVVMKEAEQKYFRLEHSILQRGES
ncbi:hypothetical protein [Jeotgalibacillus campisalis]|uniref:Uncharacterized protein n=1 Tax=Jeotgalibacillus campisalis TaxID=220754 RepID=A0A0C2W2M6_9BACL|nr:hypothetical protein [Jeotgalibacillus campisalis]KIL50881.1 hypothetical protein KR50_07620 [Jeotgalibacillus campisalis]